MISTSQVSVGTTATTLFTASGKTNIAIRKLADNTNLYIGISSVTTGNGFWLKGTDTPVYLTLSHGDVLYGIVQSGTEAVALIATN